VLENFSYGQFQGRFALQNLDKFLKKQQIGKEKWSFCFYSCSFSTFPPPECFSFPPHYPGHYFILLFFF